MDALEFSNKNSHCHGIQEEVRRIWSQVVEVNLYRVRRWDELGSAVLRVREI